MHALRRSLSTAGRRIVTPAPTADLDNELVRTYVNDITEACVDLIDVPIDTEYQRRVINVILTQGPAAAQAMERLQRAHSATPVTAL